MFAGIGIVGSGYFIYFFVKNFSIVRRETERTLKMNELVDLEIQERRKEMQVTSAE